MIKRQTVAVTQSGGMNPALANVVRIDMSRDRKLDRGNARPSALAEDFGRLGLVLWPALSATSRRAAAWNRNLEALNVARNAIAHDDQGQFLKLQQLGYPSINLSVVRRWKTSLDSLAVAMDDVVAGYLALLLGGPRPW
jgi:hypothetical protein